MNDWPHISGKAIAVILCLLVSVIPVAGIVSSSGHVNVHAAGNSSLSSSVAGITHDFGTNRAPYSVNPMSFYSKEPAPMGVADYGIGSGSQPYAYNSTSFVGTVNIGSLFSNASSGGNGTSFQLNVNLNFTVNGNTYVYWVQDVALVNTTSSGAGEQVQFIDNVWNFTGRYVYSSTLSGNGTVQAASGSSLYYYVASGQIGNDTFLNAPYTIKMRAISTSSGNGVPEVIMQYSDGYGWVTYDNIYFKFATSSVTDRNFVVQGYGPTPAGSFEDAEIIMGGPGGGSNSNMSSGSLSMSLQYWNGHNYQYVPNAYNFGSDTAETSTNVSISGTFSVPDASLSSTLTVGTGSLGTLYSLSSMSVLNLSLPFAAGTAKVNNATYNFTGYALNLTLAPGKYSVELTSDGGKTNSANFMISAGKTYDIGNATFSKKYKVNLSTVHLPPGTPWSVTTQNGSVYNFSMAVGSLELTNGTYSLIISGSNGFVYNGSDVNFTISGSGRNLTVYFSETFPVIFKESGLTGIVWFVSLGGHNLSQVKSSMTFKVTNGTYSYKITRIDGYRSTPASGTVSINGSGANISILFSPILYNVTFDETGLPPGHSWSVIVNGEMYNSTGSSLTIQLQNGSFLYNVTSGGQAYTPAGYSPTLTVNGVPQNISITFTNDFNTGADLYYKLIFVAFAAVVSLIGATLLRRR